MVKKIPPIAITTGDHKGIGPEVISKGLYRLREKLKPEDVVIFGDPQLYEPFQRFLPKNCVAWSEADFLNPKWPGPLKKALNFIEVDASLISKENRDAYCCGRYIELAAKGALAGKFSAITTGPIDKNELHKGGYLFDGHTEMLKNICGAKSVTMMMAGEKMRTTLVTTHVALKDVAKKLTTPSIIRCIEHTANALFKDFGISQPNIAVLGLNPHAGDAGLFGSEERTIILPAIKISRKKHKKATIKGPFPPDGFFALWKAKHQRQYHAIVCMYHDQGLIPIKLIDFENTVNVTLGLPIVRTSVDHGVGYDIAGKNKADAKSFCAALKLAQELVTKRKVN